MIVNANEFVYPTLRIITDRTFFLYDIEPILLKHSHKFAEFHILSSTTRINTTLQCSRMHQRPRLLQPARAAARA